MVKVRVYIAGLISPTGITLCHRRLEKRTTSRNKCIRLRQTQLFATNEHACSVLWFLVRSIMWSTISGGSGMGVVDEEVVG